MRKMHEIVPKRKLIKETILSMREKRFTPVTPSRYFEFSNKVKIMSGYGALENIPKELHARGKSRPMLILQKQLIDQGVLNSLIKALKESKLVIGRIFYFCKPIALKCIEQAVSELKEYNCDSVISVGEGSAFELGKEISGCIGESIPFISVPTSSSGIGITSYPDVAVLDPRMTQSLAPREIISMAMDTICHAIETYTCSQKNPLSDSYAITAIKLVRDNLEAAIKNGKEKNTRLALANAALLSGIACINSQTGIAHSIAIALTKSYGVSHAEAIGIIQPHCMDFNLIKLDEYYSELLLPLAGAEIYADTLRHERGRKLIQIIRNILLDYHQKYDLPVCLSEIGVKRADFNTIAAHSLHNENNVNSNIDFKEEDIINILNLAF